MRTIELTIRSAAGCAVFPNVRSAFSIFEGNILRVAHPESSVLFRRVAISYKGRSFIKASVIPMVLIPEEAVMRCDLRNTPWNDVCTE